jgi:hypothetical protein
VVLEELPVKALADSVHSLSLSQKLLALRSQLLSQQRLPALRFERALQAQRAS